MAYLSNTDSLESERIKMTFNIWKAIKITIIFVGCTCIFYFGLQAMHEEYEHFHRYDEPEGPAVKVFNKNEERLIDRLVNILK